MCRMPLVRAGDPDLLLDDWLSWSGDMSNFDERECLQKWRSFSNEGTRSGRKNFGTLVNWVKALDGDILNDSFDPDEFQSKWLRQGRIKSLEFALKRDRVQKVEAEVDVGQILQSGLQEIDQSGLGGADLTAKLLNLAVATGQPYHSSARVG